MFQSSPSPSLIVNTGVDMDAERMSPLQASLHAAYQDVEADFMNAWTLSERADAEKLRQQAEDLLFEHVYQYQAVDPDFLLPAEAETNADAVDNMKQVGPRPCSTAGHNVHGEDPPQSSKPLNAPFTPLDHNVVVAQIQSDHAAQAHTTLSTLTRSRAALRHRELCLLHSALDLSAAVAHAHRALKIGAYAPFPPPLLARLRALVVNARSKVKRNRLGRLEAKFGKAVQKLKAACAEREIVDGRIKDLAARMKKLLTDGEMNVVEGCLLGTEFEIVEKGAHVPYSRLGLTAEGGWLES